MQIQTQLFQKCQLTETEKAENLVLRHLVDTEFRWKFVSVLNNQWITNSFSFLHTALRSVVLRQNYENLC